LPFHPTIGSEAFILSTLATPVPSHGITKEFMPIFNDPFSFTSSTRIITCFLSIKLAAFYSSLVLYILLEISLFVTALTRFIRCFLNIKLVAFGSFSTGEFLAFSTLLFILWRALHAHPSYLVPSVKRKPGSVWVCRTLWYFRLTFCS
jgi:hypothetical protein